MKVLLFGATGMIGQGVLRECLLDPGVERVVTIGRSATGQQHAKLTEIVFRPGVIQPLHGIRSRTTLYRVLYVVMGPVLPLLRRILPRYVTTTEVIGRAMLKIARHGADVRVLESAAINRYGAAAGG